MGKIIKLKEEDLIPGSQSQEPIFPYSVSQASHTVYEEQYPGTPEIQGRQVIDVRTDLANLWLVLGNTAIKPQTLVRLPYDGNEHPLSVPSTCRYKLIYQGTEAPKRVGTYYYKAQLLPGYTWRDLTTEEVEVILEIYATKSALPSNVVEGANVTYNEALQQLCVEHRPDNYTGEITYSLDGSEYSTTIPTATNAGNYTVKVKCAEDDNYTASEFEATGVIGKKPIAYPSITPAYAYNKSEQHVKYTDGTLVEYGVKGGYTVLEDSKLTATDVSTLNLYFEPTANYMWATTKSSVIYSTTWRIYAIPYGLTYTLDTEYKVGNTLASIVSNTDVNLNYYWWLNNTKGEQIVLPHTFTKAEINSTAQIYVEFAQAYPNYSSIANPKSNQFIVSINSNTIEWHPEQGTSFMSGTAITLRAKATSGKVVFRLGSPSGETAGGKPELKDGYYTTTWTPTASGTYNIYTVNSEWDDVLYNQASTVSKAFSITAQSPNTITWNGDVIAHYLGETLTLPSTAVTNPTYTEVAKIGSVAYYKGDYSYLADNELPSVEALASPYTIVAADLSGLTITAFNINYDKEYVTVAKKVVKSFNVAKREGTMTIGTYSPSAYIDDNWTWEVTIPSGTIDFQIKTSEGWSSLYGDSRAVITPLGDNKYRLTYQFVAPSGRTQMLRVHNTPATGYKDPTNQDFEISVGILSKSNVITITDPTTESISVQIGDKINASAYATSGYVQFYNGNPDDTVNPGTLITEGYVSGLSGEPCSISNYAITKATTLIYVKNTGYDGAYAQASNKYFKVLASELVPLTIAFESGATGEFTVGTPITFDAKVYNSAGTAISGYNIEYYVNDTKIEGNTYTPTTSDAFVVKALCTNPSAISGYIVSPASTLKNFTVKEFVAWYGYSETFDDLPTEETMLSRSTGTMGFTGMDTSASPYNSPKSFWVCCLVGHTCNVTNSFGAQALSDAVALGTKYIMYYKKNRVGFSSVLNCVVN